MERNKILEEINEIARDVFENENILLNETTTAADIEEWDSLSHLNFISDIEEKYAVTLTLAEISESKNVAEIVDAVIRHLDRR